MSLKHGQSGSSVTAVAVGGAIALFVALQVGSHVRRFHGILRAEEAKTKMETARKLFRKQFSCEKTKESSLFESVCAPGVGGQIELIDRAGRIMVMIPQGSDYTNIHMHHVKASCVDRDGTSLPPRPQTVVVEFARIPQESTTTLEWHDMFPIQLGCDGPV